MNQSEPKHVGQWRIPAAVVILLVLLCLGVLEDEFWLGSLHSHELSMEGLVFIWHGCPSGIPPVLRHCYTPLGCKF